ncbi:MAG: hypothetical protein WDA42_09095 [Candidatus Bathyarchaeia archaeon]
MFEYRHKNRKYVIIEVADIFYAQNKAEEIPDETFHPVNGTQFYYRIYN